MTGQVPANEGHNVLINVAAAARFGYTPQQAIGKTIIYSSNHVNIVGVLGNVKMEGAREPVKPTVYFNDSTALMAFGAPRWTRHSGSAHLNRQNLRVLSRRPPLFGDISSATASEHCTGAMKSKGRYLAFVLL